MVTKNKRFPDINPIYFSGRNFHRVHKVHIKVPPPLSQFSGDPAMGSVHVMLPALFIIITAAVSSARKKQVI